MRTHTQMNFYELCEEVSECACAYSGIISCVLCMICFYELLFQSAKRTKHASQNTMKPALCVVLLALACSCRAGPPAPSQLRGMLAEKEEAGSIWALLVAGSNTWMNYRHQVGVCKNL